MDPSVIIMGRFTHFPVRAESFRPESCRPRVVSPTYHESFRPLFDECAKRLGGETTHGERESGQNDSGANWKVGEMTRIRHYNGSFRTFSRLP